jgi:2-polyprenyl-3-methyl-5-hydroxy-6-metoxy-1,4-benzoquinol methylase
VTHPLTLTGERTLPGIEQEAYWFSRHDAAYRWVVDHLGGPLADAVVVEAGCGEGYGAQRLRQAGARLVAGIDYDADSCAHAASSYPGVRVVRANLAQPPLRPASADVVVSMQVLEHLWDPRGFLAACRGAQPDGGTVVVTTPNRLTFSPGIGRGERPTNPFHAEEFDAEQLRAMLAGAGYRDIRMRCVRHGERLLRWEATHGSLVAAQVDAVRTGVWPADLTAMVASVTAEDFEVDDEDVDSGLDLLAVATAGVT